MALSAEKEMAHIGESCGCADHDHDLIHDLSKRLDALWRYDQYVANADGKPALQTFWRDMKRKELENVKRVKQLISEEIKQKCFKETKQTRLRQDREHSARLRNRARL